MKLEYIVFRYSCEYKTLSRHHISPYLILTFGKLIKKSRALPMKRLTKKRIDLLTTAEESLYPTFWGVLRVETKEDRFQRLYEILLWLRILVLYIIMKYIAVQFKEMLIKTTPKH